MQRLKLLIEEPYQVIHSLSHLKYRPRKRSKVRMIEDVVTASEKGGGKLKRVFAEGPIQIEN